MGNSSTSEKLDADLKRVQNLRDVADLPKREGHQQAQNIKAADKTGRRDILSIEEDDAEPLVLLCYINLGNEETEAEVHPWEEVGVSLERELKGMVQQVSLAGQGVSSLSRWEELGVEEGTKVSVEIKLFTGVLRAKQTSHSVDTINYARAVVNMGYEGIASAHEDGTIRVWDPWVGSIRKNFDGHSGSVNCLAVLGGMWLVSGSKDNTIRVWNLVDEICERILKGHRDTVYSVAALEDGSLASGSEDHTVRTWDIGTGRCSLVLKGHTARINTVACLRDGKLASGGNDSTIRIWNLMKDGKCEMKLGGAQNGWCFCVKSLEDGKLVSSHANKTICLWDSATGACERVLEGHSHWVLSLVSLGDGRLASGSRDATIRLWDLATGECLSVLNGHKKNVTAVEDLGDGRLASSSFDETVRVWGLEPLARCDSKLSFSADTVEF